MAPMHNRTSLIDLAVAPTSDGVRIRAEVRYTDGDAVLNEDLVGIVRATATGATQPLTLAAADDSGSYTADVPLAPGQWDVEVEAVTFTTGSRTISFTLTPAGTVANVHGIAPLPDSLARPVTTRSRVAAILTIVLILALGVLGLFVIRQLRHERNA
jgi:hypothetical protein